MGALLPFLAVLGIYSELSPKRVSLEAKVALSTMLLLFVVRLDGNLISYFIAIGVPIDLDCSTNVSIYWSGSVSCFGLASGYPPNPKVYEQFSVLNVCLLSRYLLTYPESILP